VANAVLEECGGAADFYESFQEKVRFLHEVSRKYPQSINRNLSID
jgi:hypothetical protein